MNSNSPKNSISARQTRIAPPSRKPTGFHLLIFQESTCVRDCQLIPCVVMRCGKGGAAQRRYILYSRTMCTVYILLYQLRIKHDIPTGNDMYPCTKSYIMGELTLNLHVPNLTTSTYLAHVNRNKFKEFTLIYHGIELHQVTPATASTTHPSTALTGGVSVAAALLVLLLLVLEQQLVQRALALQVQHDLLVLPGHHLQQQQQQQTETEKGWSAVSRHHHSTGMGRDGGMQQRHCGVRVYLREGVGPVVVAPGMDGRQQSA